VTELKPEISQQFGNQKFQNDLKNRISEHFAYLIQKGFSISVNGEKIRPLTLRLFSTDLRKQKGIRPYDFEAREGEVNIKVTVGFYRPLATIEDLDTDTSDNQSSDTAGISVICNDRLVLVNDTSMKTGWGDGGVPKYHPQFRGIAGFIIFSTTSSERLPISTTKRDLDIGSDLYLTARQACMEGLTECTSFTNKWKGMEEDANVYFAAAKKKDARTEIQLATKHGTTVRGNKNARKSLADLPIPESRNPMRRISFTRKESQVQKVSKALFNELDQKPSIVGQECFDRVLRKAEAK
jgi:hypothetical protein